MPIDFRAVPRFFMMTALPVTFGYAEANVVDLSVRGARLQVTRPYVVGPTLPLVCTAAERQIVPEATVSWCRMAALSLDDEESDRYLVGIAFDRDIPEIKDVVDNLLNREEAMRIEDARAAERYTITAQLTGSFGIYSPVRLLDLSIRGARIGSDRPVVEGTSAPLRFRVGRQHIDLNAIMVWSRPAERRGGFEAGLRIDGEEELLRQIIAHFCTQNQARIDLNSLRRKFDPMHGEATTGLLALV